MRIGCLQFAPQVADVDNNLNRADSVLSKANPDDLDSLDLLVLPELAFTGYNFKSLQQISPFLEPSRSGISSLWARTIALRYNTTVVVGYPEKVDVSARWPTSPEYYNSAIVVNGEGETIANYRKSFLFTVDETWALEGRGFFGGYLPGLGNTAIGICMDLNPYKFEAPWHAFEFGHHVLRVRADLVIVTMAWLTREDGRLYSRLPAEPDLETLTYWVQRLEPLIRSENEEEVIVVFCNRTGSEDDVLYAGTSAVIGVKGGEVSVYGLLGRGVKDLLVVDTDTPPIAKLVHRPDGEGQEAGSQMVDQRPPTSNNGKVSRASMNEDAGNSSHSSSASGRDRSSPQESAGKQRRNKPATPTITIPERRKYATVSVGDVIAESPTIPTPTHPSPTPISVRPKFEMPETKSTEKPRNTPYQDRVPSGQIPFHGSTDHAVHDTSSHDNGDFPEKYFFVPSQTLIATPRDPWAKFAPDSPASLIRYSGSAHDTRRTYSLEKTGSISRTEPGSDSSIRSGRSGDSRADDRGASKSGNKPGSNATTGGEPYRPSSPKSRNASRNGRPLTRRGSEIQQPDLTGVAQRLEAFSRQSELSMDHDHNHEDGRHRSPRSRNASRTGRPIDVDQALDERLFNISQASIPIAASPGALAGPIDRPNTDIFQNIDNRFYQRFVNPAGVRPSSRAEQQTIPMSRSSVGPRSRSTSGMTLPNGDAAVSHMEPDESRTMVWSEISKIVGEVLERPESRSVSRGRQLSTGRSPPGDVQIPRSALSESRGLPTALQLEQRLPSREGRGTGTNMAVGQTMSPTSQVNRPYGSVAPYHPDEIVAEIIFHAPGCPTHSHRNTPSQSNAGTPSQVNNPTPHQRNNSRPSQMSNPRFNHRINSASGRTDSNSSPNRRPVASQPPVDMEDMEISIFKAPTPSTLIGGREPAESCPALSGSSIHTVGSLNGSPSTPVPRVFEPTTPKAMKLDPNFGAILSSISDPVKDGSITSLSSLGNRLAAEIGSGRPKSVVW